MRTESYKAMTDAQKARFEAYIETLHLDGPQQEAWNAIFNNRHFVLQIQGPPGTGKTHTVSSIAMSMALLNIKTALCAPSNVATRVCLKNLIKQYNKIKEIDPDAAKDILIVYLPPTSRTKINIEKVSKEELLEAAYTAIFEEDGGNGDPFSEFRMDRHIIRSMTEKSAVGAPNTALSRWLTVHQQLREGGTVSESDLRDFVGQRIKEMTSIFRDPRVKLVVSTFNNADQMYEYKYKPDGCIMDEAASATEPESMIPLSLGARHNILVGDHEQHKPVVRSVDYNEFQSQLGLSMFARHCGRPNVPLVRLKLNYRMHPDIAELPCMLSYEWLASHESTTAESDAYRFYEDWWKSDSGLMMRSGERKPEFEGVQDEGCRVRWFNPDHSYGAPKPDGHSLRNFGNINACVELVMRLIRHQPSGGIPDIKGSDITILTPYHDDVVELRRQVEWAITHRYPEFRCFPRCTTIGKIQGGEDEIVILLLPAHHPSILGFMKEFGRFLVAGTRARSVYNIIGPFDGLRDYLKVLVQGMRCKKLGLMMMDYASKGRVIDIVSSNTLPAHPGELDDYESWSHELNACPSSLLKLPFVMQDMQDSYTKEERQVYERELYAELGRIRQKAQDCLERFHNGEEVETSPYAHTVEGHDEQNEDEV